MVVEQAARARDEPATGVTRPGETNADRGSLSEARAQII
jgi:hypothetical protein